MSAGPRRQQPHPGSALPPAPVGGPGGDRAVVRNADCPWDSFDSDSYLAHNYRVLHELDRAIIDRLADFFGSLAPSRPRWHGIDVGTGTNLYPALSMLPMTETITLWEHSLPNIRWLEQSLRPYGQVWDPFWQALAASCEVYRRFPQPRVSLPARVKLEKASVFDLPEAGWDIGTMFFVAESITSVRSEFVVATTRFVRALRPGSPFAAAFVRNSDGYTVGGQRFPAVAVTEDDIGGVLEQEAEQVEIHLIGSAQRFREGYDGMVLATGKRAAGTTDRHHRARS